MFRNLLERLPGRGSALVLVGYAHVSEISRRLERAGYAPDRFERSEKRTLFATAGRDPLFPPGLTRCLQQNIAARRAELDQESDPAWQSAIRANLAVRQEMLRLIEQVGERPARSAGR